MQKLDALIQDLARGEELVLNRDEILGAGGDDDYIARRCADGWLTRIQAGAYLVGLGPPSLRQRQIAACKAGTATAVLSHRAAGANYGLSCCTSRLVEVTISHHERAAARGVVVHRSHRQPPWVLVNGIPTTAIERTLVDLGRYLPPKLLEKAMESAIRKGLTTATAITAFLDHEGKGLRGAKRLREVMGMRPEGGPAGSDAEVELIQFLRDAGAPMPVRQHLVTLEASGWAASLDLAWPDRRKAISWDGWDFHSGREDREYDLARKHALEDLGWDLREYTGGMLRTNPKGVARSVLRFLGAKSRP